jgi:outer membrane protein, heavy metal efflux system
MWTRVFLVVPILWALVTWALLSATAVAQPPAPITPLTRDDAVRLALTENPMVRAKRFELESIRANEITAGLRPNPTGTYLAEQFGSQGNTASTQYTLALAQTIETGGKRQRRLDSARAATRVSGHELRDIERQVLFQTNKSFTDVLVAQATLTLAEENLKTLDEFERLQRLRAERGDISELDLARIQIQRFTFERDAADARQALQAAKIALRAVVAPDRIPAEFEVAGDLPFRDLSYSREEVHAHALRNRPDLAAAEASRQKARADVELARANAWWDFAPQVEYQRIGNDNTIGFGVSLPLRIFDRNQGEIARTKSEVSRVDAQRQVVLTQVLADVDTALSTVTNEREKLRLLRDVYLPKAQQARDTVEYAYRRGGLSLLDYLDAQRTYRETSLGYLHSLGNYWSAVYQLEAAVGGRLP